jgi:hypothetical protein
MGNAASFFFNTTTPTECLDWRIRPSDEQFDAQQERWNSLKDYLLSTLQTRSGYSVSSWLQGSYKFGTQIRPPRKSDEFDIDLGVYFNWPGEPADGEHQPQELKNLVQESLEAYVELDENDAEAVSEPKPRCNRIHFADNFHIDVPSYHLDANRDKRALATQDGNWESSDPKAIYKWWRNLIDEEDRPRARRLVRYLKIWAALKFEESDRPSSILLTILVAEAFLEIERSQLSGDDEFLHAIVMVSLDRLRHSSLVANPIDRTENLNRLTRDAVARFVDALGGLLLIAERALAAPAKSQAADIWSEAFEHFFPIPDQEDVPEETSTALVPLRFLPEVQVVATVESNPSRQFRGVNSIGPIPKGCKIVFALANASALPLGAIVTWTVRNEGQEAEQENDLGHRAGTGFSASRNSAYAGRHFMDVTVRVNGMLIGQRRVPVTIHGIRIPVPKITRPEWTKFRSKRR